MSNEKITLENGAVYEGEVADGEFQGKGKYTYPDGLRKKLNFLSSVLWQMITPYGLNR